MNDDETQPIVPEKSLQEAKNINFTKKIFHGPARVALVVAILLVVAIGLLSIVGGRFVGEVTQGAILTSTSSTIIAIDSPATTFSLPDGLGGVVSLAEFKSSPVLLLFWASWNNQSLDQVHILSGVNIPPGVVVLTVNTQEDPAKARSALERGKYNIKVVYDENGSIGELYGAKNLPALFFIDKEGNIRNIAVGVTSEGAIMERVEKFLY